MKRVIYFCAYFCACIITLIHFSLAVASPRVLDSNFYKSISSSPLTDLPKLQIPPKLTQVCEQYQVVPLPTSAGHLCSKPDDEKEHGYCSLILSNVEIAELQTTYRNQIYNGTSGFCDDLNKNCNCGLAPDGKPRRACVYYAAPVEESDQYFQLGDITYRYPLPINSGVFRQKTKAWLGTSKDWLLPGDIVALKASEIGDIDSYYKWIGLGTVVVDEAETLVEKAFRNYIGTNWDFDTEDFDPEPETGLPNPNAIIQPQGFNGTPDNPIYFAAEDSLRYRGCYHIADDVVHTPATALSDITRRMPIFTGNRIKPQDRSGVKYYNDVSFGRCVDFSKKSSNVVVHGIYCDGGFEGHVDKATVVPETTTTAYDAWCHYQHDSNPAIEVSLRQPIFPSVANGAYIGAQSHDISIQHSRFNRIGLNGVLIETGSHFNQIANNLITNVFQRQVSAVSFSETELAMMFDNLCTTGIYEQGHNITVRGSGNHIVHNTIFRGGHGAIELGGDVDDSRGPRADIGHCVSSPDDIDIPHTLKSIDSGTSYNLVELNQFGNDINRIGLAATCGHHNVIQKNVFHDANENHLADDGREAWNLRGNQLLFRQNYFESLYSGGVKVVASFSVLSKATDVRVLHNTFYQSGYEAVQILRKDLPFGECRGETDRDTGTPLDLRYCHEDISGLRLMNNQILNTSLLGPLDNPANYTNLLSRYFRRGIPVTTYEGRPALRFSFDIGDGLEKAIMDTVKVSGNLFNHPMDTPVMCTTQGGQNCVPSTGPYENAHYGDANALSDSLFLTHPAIGTTSNLNDSGTAPTGPHILPWQVGADTSHVGIDRQEIKVPTLMSATDTADWLTNVRWHIPDSNELILSEAGFFMGYSHQPTSFDGSEHIVLTQGSSVIESTIISIEIIEAGGQLYDRVVLDAPIAMDLTGASVSYLYSGAKPDIGVYQRP